jgi:hypothetical protein
MAVRKKPSAHPDVRQYLADKTESVLLKMMREVGDHRAAERCERWIQRVRDGGEVVVHWYELPEGTFPQESHNPCEYVVVGSDDVIRWEGP